MKLPAIITADLHLTANPRDKYRWGLIPWLMKQQAATKAKTLAILGDLTDAKDYHPATLVNEVVMAVHMLRDGFFEEITILEGNHDYLKGGETFFEFLSQFDDVRFITKFATDHRPPCAVCWLPYSKTPAMYHDKTNGPDFTLFDYVFMHQTVGGAVASNGQSLPGEMSSRFPTRPQYKIYSGDIHVPQTTGDVEYIGSPYHVHFGDKFNPRTVLIEQPGRERDLHFDTIHRITADIKSVDELERLKLREGDQVKVRVDLPPYERYDWSRIKRQIMAYCKHRGVYVHGVDLVSRKTRRRLLGSTPTTEPGKSPEDNVCEFVRAEDLGGEMLDVGLELLE